MLQNLQAVWLSSDSHLCLTLKPWKVSNPCFFPLCQLLPPKHSQTSQSLSFLNCILGVTTPISWNCCENEVNRHVKYWAQSRGLIPVSPPPPSSASPPPPACTCLPLNQDILAFPNHSVNDKVLEHFVLDSKRMPRGNHCRWSWVWSAGPYKAPVSKTPSSLIHSQRVYDNNHHVCLHSILAIFLFTVNVSNLISVPLRSIDLPHLHSRCAKSTYSNCNFG